MIRLKMKNVNTKVKVSQALKQQENQKLESTEGLFQKKDEK